MIYVFLADGFEETEALAPVDIMRRAKLEVKTVGVTGKTVTSSHNIPVIADMSIDEIETQNLEAIVLPGGMPGTLNLKANDKVLSTVKYAYENDLIIGAICAAPSVLGYLGILDGKIAVCYPGFEQELKGAIIQNFGVVTDGNIITAKGAGVSIEFGLALVKELKGEETSNAIRASIQSM